MVYDALIIGGGVSGMQCALVLGSGLSKPYGIGKKVGIIFHQRSSHLQNALFNNVLGLNSGALGKDILIKGKHQLLENYPDVELIEQEKVNSVAKKDSLFSITSNKKEYSSKIVVLALNYSKPFTIEGLDQYIVPHRSANPEKDRIQLVNTNHLIEEGLYACGTIAGWRSQFSIAAGSGASVATDILTLWNDGIPTKVHDKI